MASSKEAHLQEAEEGLLGVDLELEEWGSNGQRDFLGTFDVDVVDDVPDGLLRKLSKRCGSSVGNLC